jgi:hypothetical protein
MRTIIEVVDIPALNNVVGGYTLPHPAQANSRWYPENSPVSPAPASESNRWVLDDFAAAVLSGASAIIGLSAALAMRWVGLSPIAACAASGILLALIGLSREWSGPTVAGGYAGALTAMGAMGAMSNDIVINGILLAGPIATVVTVVGMLSRRHPGLALVGIGGRLGVMALTAYLVAMKAGGADLPPPKIIPTTGYLILLPSILTGTFTAARLRHGKVDDGRLAVFVSAAVGLTGDLLPIGGLASQGVYLGSFIGMSAAPVLVPGRLVVAGIIAALIYPVLAALFGACAGLLGATAALAILLTGGARTGWLNTALTGYLRRSATTVVEG